MLVLFCSLAAGMVARGVRPARPLGPLGAAASESIAAPDAKAAIERLSAGTENGIRASDEAAAEIAALIAGLENANPTADIATSGLLDGTWQLVYTTTKGSSAGALGPFVGTVSQIIDLGAGSYVNLVELPLLTGKLGATWDVEGPDTWTVNFEFIEFFLFGQSVTKKPLTAKGTWEMTYLDSDFRILRAQGKKDAPPNVYVLKRRAP
ncbi:hypothetical protein CTAYLR_010788 [Chrysophaeum taylorii]|uniref:Plastid lipid-associated protein/fibrillin conserved domain-containing protein n=1 Tax=Chrysophaeum taylorii TaxID=2483200 RepID=A0AAD7UIM1_9STRA|nr:hypothetical protein CTAYLR_010788 [Chrysophaeum taylorii]